MAWPLIIMAALQAAKAQQDQSNAAVAETANPKVDLGGGFAGARTEIAPANTKGLDLALQGGRMAAGSMGGTEGPASAGNAANLTGVAETPEELQAAVPGKKGWGGLFGRRP